MAAGGHYDPANTGKHLGPHGEGHKDDLPALSVDASGKTTKAVMRRTSRWPTLRAGRSSSSSAAIIIQTDRHPWWRRRAHACGVAK
jgi:Cu/Zn superoxide dismutase